MNITRLRPLLFTFAMLFWSVGGPATLGRADAPLNTPAEPEAGADEDFAVPPGDPWAAPQPQQRGSRPNAADRLVFKARIVPHWFGDHTRFWYRNDLSGGAKEFLLVDAERGHRAPAFDHQKLAAALRKAAGVDTYRADRLPFDDIEFVDDAKAIRFQVGEATWSCALETYQCSRAKSHEAAPPSSRRPGEETAAAR